MNYLGFILSRNYLTSGCASFIKCSLTLSELREYEAGIIFINLAKVIYTTFTFSEHISAPIAFAKCFLKTSLSDL
jgi:ACR3 family arsenite efflux pump ArsB